LIVKTFIQLATIAVAQQQPKQAIQYYQQALNHPITDAELHNQIVVHLALLQPEYMPQAIEQTHRLDANIAKLNALLALAKPSAQIELYQQALQLALQLDKPRYKSLAYGYLAEYYQVYQQDQQDQQVLQLLQSALFFAQQERDLLYRWQWRKAQLYHRQQKTEQAIQYYQKSISNIENIRTALLRSYSTEQFEMWVKPVYFELIDILLQQASHTGQNQALLTQTIEVLETYKSLELENYFKDDCVTQAKQTTAQTLLPTRTAIFYPILLENRTELILSIQNRLIQTTVLQQSAKDLTWLIQRFVKQLDKRTGQKIAAWLITPIRTILEQHQIDTLVIVPYDILYTLPFAALHDGTDYLIKDYAIVITPSLALTTLKSTRDLSYQILAGGLSKPMEQFSALPYVNQELAKIEAIWQPQQLLKNERFQFDVLYHNLKQQSYSLLHFATHAQIMPKVKDSFLLTYNGKMNLNQLEQLVRLRQFQQQPVELLTLSACQTAQTGDKQAALGIAGLAIKSGANSVLASLWAIDDAATAKLIPLFYQKLATQKLSKAQALQQAQWKLMQLTTYHHPRYWSGFILIGNWL